MGLGVRVGLNLDLAPAVAMTDAVAARIRDWTPVLRGPVHRSVSRFFLRQFETEGAEGGTRWAPHRPLTVRLRRRPGHGRGGIGRDTNRLWASLVKVGPESVLVTGPTEYERGTTVAHAAPFHAGVSPGRQRVFGRAPLVPLGIPARTLVPDPFPRTYVDGWAAALARYIETGVAE